MDFDKPIEELQENSGQVLATAFLFISGQIVGFVIGWLIFS